MAGASSIYRDDSEDVAAALVWETVKAALPPLHDVVTREIELQNNPKTVGGVSDKRHQSRHP